jgi:hypothetical protein
LQAPVHSLCTCGWRAGCAAPELRQQLAQFGRRHIVQMPERWCDLADFRVRDAELLKIDFPRPDGLPDLRHHLRGFGLGEGELCMRGQCVVQGGQSPLRAHAQMQEALGGVACSGQDVVQRAQAPAGLRKKSAVMDILGSRTPKKQTQLNINVGVLILGVTLKASMHAAFMGLSVRLIKVTIAAY